MSHSKIIELRKFGKQASGNDFDNNHDLATQQECIRLLRAFTQIDCDSPGRRCVWTPVQVTAALRRGRLASSEGRSTLSRL